MGKDVALEREFDVALVNMPFGSLQTPSIGLSLLQAALGRCNISSRVFYFTFRFVPFTWSVYRLNALADAEAAIVNFPEKVQTPQEGSVSSQATQSFTEFR